MMPHQALIALGGNLGDVLHAFRTARAHLMREAGTLIASSRLYRTAPLLPEDPFLHHSADAESTSSAGATYVPDYLNAACLLHTQLQPEALLALMQHIESLAGRRRSVRWASRQLDLDLLAYDALSMTTPELTVPHPRLRQRAFVLYPLVDIAPDFALPPDAITPQELLKAQTAPHVGIEMVALSW
jgi:2-amino-4-hydroxy-6-hydroxymethyldihydropteridine diphosphokinase